jgi:DNA invertase Pin-like site-specific DNA recombinase
MIVGYRRSSTVEQKAGYDAQLETLRQAGCEKVFGEMVSSVSERAELDKALEFVCDGDVFVATALSRVARSLPQMFEITEALKRKGVTLRILDMGIDTSNSTGKLMINLIGSICQWEREVMLERQRIGIAKAHTDKRYRGRKPVAAPNADAVRSLKAEGWGMTQIAKKLGISRASVYRALESA